MGNEIPQAPESCKTIWVLLGSGPDHDIVGTYSSYFQAVAARIDAWKRHSFEIAIVPTDLDKLIE